MGTGSHGVDLTPDGTRFFTPSEEASEALGLSRHLYYPDKLNREQPDYKEATRTPKTCYDLKRL